MRETLLHSSFALWLAAFVTFPCIPSANAQAFNCGSNGSYGAINITQDTTLQMPQDGVFHCTTVNIALGTTLRFAHNIRNTPVYILATGDVTIRGMIDVSGKQSSAGATAGGRGGPGGFDGGNGSVIASVTAGSGHGPGGGPGGRGTTAPIGSGGSFRSVGVIHYPVLGGGSIYGNSLLIPLIGGSGGGGSNPAGGSVLGGGGGGGAILIASNTRVVFDRNSGSQNSATILAKGGAGVTQSHSQGSGGAVRIVAPIVSGVSNVDVRTADSSNSNGLGRFRIDSLDSASYSVLSGSSAPDSIGLVMVVFPTPTPKLSVVSAAGTPIADNAAAPVIVNLPTGSPTAQQIRIRATDFGGIVPVRIRLIPEKDDAITYDTTIDNSVNNPAEATISVNMPIGTLVDVQVYTR